MSFVRSKTHIVTACAGLALFLWGLTAFAQTASLPVYATKRVGMVDPQSLSSNEVMWAMFHVVATQEAQTPGSGAKFLQSIGLSEPDALALAQHILASIADVKAYGNDLKETTCANTAPLASSRADFARAMRAIDSSMEERRGIHLAEIDDILSSAEKEALNLWADNSIRTHLTVTSFDPGKFLEVENLDPSAAVKRFCTVSTTPTGPTLGVALNKNTTTGVN